MACNRHHSVDKQLCRWLLLSLGRLPSNELVMTQVLIANMLGVRREGVTEAAGRLQQAGLARTCERYALVKRESDRLLLDRGECLPGFASETESASTKSHHELTARSEEAAKVDHILASRRIVRGQMNRSSQ